MDNKLIDMVDQEATDLTLHVDLCQQRYLQLIKKIDTIDDKLETMDTSIQEIKLMLSANESIKLKTYLSWAGFIIVTLVGFIIHFIFK
jgi:hypothetical protein